MTVEYPEDEAEKRLRDLIREAHGVSKDLRSMIREAKDVAATEARTIVLAEMRQALDAVMPEIIETVEEAKKAVFARFRRIENVLLDRRRPEVSMEDFADIIAAVHRMQHDGSPCSWPGPDLCPDLVTVLEEAMSTVTTSATTL